MPLNLSNPIVETRTINKIEITGQYFDMEQGEVRLEYMTFLDDGTPHQRDSITISGQEMLDRFQLVNDRVSAQATVNVHEAIKQINFETIVEKTGFTGVIE